MQSHTCRNLDSGAQTSLWARWAPSLTACHPTCRDTGPGNGQMLQKCLFPTLLALSEETKSPWNEVRLCSHPLELQGQKHVIKVAAPHRGQGHPESWDSRQGAGSEHSRWGSYGATCMGGASAQQPPC